MRLNETEEFFSIEFSNVFVCEVYPSFGDEICVFCEWIIRKLPLRRMFYKIVTSWAIIVFGSFLWFLGSWKGAEVTQSCLTFLTSNKHRFLRKELTSEYKEIKEKLYFELLFWATKPEFNAKSSQCNFSLFDAQCLQTLQDANSCPISWVKIPPIGQRLSFLGDWIWVIKVND